MNKNEDIYLSLQGVHKKFGKDLHSSLRYGVGDVLAKGFGIQKDYSVLRKNEFWALKDINFELKKGEVLSLVGHNGSGKTTLMRLISGIYGLENGEIVKRAGLKMTTLFALAMGLHPLLSGRENAYLKGAFFGMSKAEIDEKMGWILDFSGLSDFIDAPFGNYSSGMKARLVLTVAFATEPDVFLIDEGFNFSDAEFKDKSFTWLRQQVHEHGKSIIMASHQERRIKMLTTRMLVMKRGQIKFETEDVDEGILFYKSQSKVLKN